MNLQPRAASCFVTGRAFQEGERVASFLVRAAGSADVVRYDVAAEAEAAFVAPGPVACRWVQPFKPRAADENAARALRLTAENLFVTLADPATEQTPENIRLVQFLALLLERKKLLRPRGRTADGAREIYEHARSKQRFEVPAGVLDERFFVEVQAQLSVLVGPPRAAAATV